MQRAHYLLAALWLAASSTAASAAPRALAYYEADGSQRALSLEKGHLKQLAADLFAVDEHGTVTGSVPKAVLAIAKAAHIRVFATVSNFGAHGFSRSIAHAVLTDETATANAIAGMRALMQNPSIAGVNVDFENVARTDRAAYTAFIRRLAASLHQAGAMTVVSVPAALSDDPKDSWTGAFDYAAIGAACDVFQLMTYDENGPWSAPGPVAGLDWVTASLTYTLSVVPAGKISLGMPAYGYDWNLTAGTGRQIAEVAVPALIRTTGGVPQWDKKAQSPSFTYTAPDGSAHVVWYENPRSARAKAVLAAQKAIGGVSVYALGMDDRAYWAAVASGLASGS